MDAVDGKFQWNAVGVEDGDKVIVDAYVGTELVDSDEITIAKPGEPGSYITSTEITSNQYGTEIIVHVASGVDSVDGYYNGEKSEGVPNADGTFSVAFYPAVPDGQNVTLKAYDGDQVQEEVVTIQ